MKIILFPAFAAAVLAPAFVAAAEPAQQRFEHDGHVYAYSVTETNGYRVISRVEEKSGKPFKLRVGTHRVRGTSDARRALRHLSDPDPMVRKASWGLFVSRVHR